MIDMTIKEIEEALRACRIELSEMKKRCEDAETRCARMVNAYAELTAKHSDLVMKYSALSTPASQPPDAGTCRCVGTRRYTDGKCDKCGKWIITEEPK